MAESGEEWCPKEHTKNSTATVFSRASLLADVQHVKTLGEQRIASYIYMYWRVQSPASRYQLSKPQKCCTPSSLHAVNSLVLAHALAKVRNFKHAASKTQHVHATAFSHLHKHLLVKTLVCGE